MAGDFARVGGAERNNIAHILGDGSVDPSFDPSADGPVYALAASGSTVYAGGLFLSIGGRGRPNLPAPHPRAGKAAGSNPAPDGGKHTHARHGPAVSPPPPSHPAPR